MHPLRTARLSVGCGTISPESHGEIEQSQGDAMFLYYVPMPSEVLKRPRIRFGVFEVDLQARELRKQGFKVKLQEQPFQILLMLLERPGEVVSREDIQKR